MASTLDNVPAKYLKYVGGKGFPRGEEGLKNCPVKGIDIDQVHEMILCCNETADYLYGEYTPEKVSYQKGSRPFLEKIAASAIDGCTRDIDKIQALLGWVNTNVLHPMGRAEQSPPDRAASEEVLIESGWGWCNEQARVYIALAQVCGFMGRVIFLCHESEPWGHTSAETLLDGKWFFTDPTYGLLQSGDQGKLLSGRDIQIDPAAKRACDDLYYRVQIRQSMRWRKTSGTMRWYEQLTKRPHDSKLFTYFALCNYII